MKKIKHPTTNKGWGWIRTTSTLPLQLTFVTKIGKIFKNNDFDIYKEIIAALEKSNTKLRGKLDPDYQFGQPSKFE